MKRSFKYYIALGLWMITSMVANAQNDQPTSFIGINAGGGASHLFLGKPFDQSNLISKPLWGGGGTVGLYYELQYKHLLFHAGLGIDYTVNRNLIFVEDMAANIMEYPTMLYNYKYDNYIERNTYGVGYIPVMLGASFKQWYFLAGAKLGLMSFANTSQDQTDVNIWATDEEVIGPMENMPNHGLTDYHFENDLRSAAMKSFNAMLSAEIGVKLNKKAWQPDTKKKMDRAERYREARRKKTFKELTHCRLSIFADYGLSNIHDYQANAVPYAGENSGGLVAVNTPTDLQLHSVLGYKPYETSPLNNLLVGVKLSVQFEIPKKAPTKGAGANPYIYVYVEDEITEMPLPNARVKIQKSGSKSIYDKYTDAKRGRVGKAFVPGEYWTHVSHYNYAPMDTIHFEHRYDFDTVRVALYPLQEVCLSVEDVITNQPLDADVVIRSVDGKYELALSTDSMQKICAKLDNRVEYVATASKEGFETYTDTISLIGDNEPIRMMPIPKKTFVLQNMHFATAQTEILPISQNALDMLYQLLVENPDLYIRIVGHTDDVGSDADNLILSQGRSHSIFQAMIDRGIDPKRIQTDGRGESEPIVPNNSDINRQKNRRVEIEIISGDENLNVERLIQEF